MDEYDIAYSFEGFIHSLIEHEIDLGSDDNVEKIKHVCPSPKIIALLKKTGKWKGD